MEGVGRWLLPVDRGAPVGVWARKVDGWYILADPGYAVRENNNISSFVYVYREVIEQIL